MLCRHLHCLLDNESAMEYQARVQPMGRSQSIPMYHSSLRLNDVVRDSDHLLETLKDLTSECDRGMSIIVNKESIKRGIQGYGAGRQGYQAHRACVVLYPVISLRDELYVAYSWQQPRALGLVCGFPTRPPPPPIMLME